MWLILVALACSQLTFAAHQFDHHAFELHETCAICVTFDRDDDVLIDAGVCPTELTIASVDRLDAPSAVLAHPGSPYSARASP